MKAVRLHARGGPEQLVYEDAPLPTPGPGEVRVRVSAAGITPAELTWDETYQSADGGDRLPSIPGHDVSGTADALGPGVSGLAVGDAVFGLVDFPRNGSAAEYVTVPAAALAAKPRTVDNVAAAAVPLSALTAWQALFDHGRLAAGDRVLIHGAAGGVGAYAVQLARWRGAEVIATASGRHAAFLTGLGAAAVIDYVTTPFEAVAKNVAVVLDTIGGATRDRSWQVLRPGGTLVTLPGPLPAGAAAAAGRPDAGGVFFIVRPSRPQLAEIARLVDDGSLRPFVEAVYPLAEARRAFERALAGHLRGKVVLRVVD
ncbi:MAG: Alcohol dehydrogenase zinc-binding domain protein [Phycisphaerales bacterium]|nr:Alcohol dehydrogenase zinc-binding domain protein [Phycisphaerales bacterium]